MNENTVRLENKPDYLPAGTRLRPLRDQIYVKPLNWEPSKLIQIAGDKRKPLRGVVVFAGPGCYPKIYNKDRSKVWESKAFRPCEVKPGDVVELGGLEIDGYLFPTVVIGTETLVQCREVDVCLVRDE
jgi:hypothetical protein